jgi:hypothetical protein
MLSSWLALATVSCGRAELRPFEGTWKLSPASSRALQAAATDSTVTALLLSTLGDARLEIGADASLVPTPGSPGVEYAVAVDDDQQLHLSAKQASSELPSTLEVGCIATVSGVCIALRVLSIDASTLEVDGIVPVHLDRIREPRSR